MKKRVFSVLLVVVLVFFNFVNISASENRKIFDEKEIFPGALKIDYPNYLNSGWQEINVLLPETSIIPQQSNVAGLRFNYGVQWKDEAKYGNTTLNHDGIWINNLILLLETCRQEPWRYETWATAEGSEMFEYRAMDLPDGSLGELALKEAATDGAVGIGSMFSGCVTILLENLVPAQGTNPTGGNDAVFDAVNMGGFRIGVDATILKHAYMYISDIEAVDSEGESIGKLFDWGNLRGGTTLDDYISIGEESNINANYSVVEEQQETSAQTFFGDLYEGMIEITDVGLAENQSGYVSMPFDEGKRIPSNAVAIAFDYVGRQMAPKYYDSDGYKGVEKWKWIDFQTFLSNEVTSFYPIGNSIILENALDRKFRNGHTEALGDFPDGKIRAMSGLANVKTHIPRGTSGKGKLYLNHVTGNDRLSINSFNTHIKQGLHMNQYYGNIYAVDSYGNVLETLIDWSTKTTEEVQGLLRFHGDNLSYDSSFSSLRVLNTKIAGYTADPDTILNRRWQFRSVGLMNLTRDPIAYTTVNDIPNEYSKNLRKAVTAAKDANANYVEVAIMLDQKATVEELLPYYIIVPNIARQHSLNVYFRPSPTTSQAHRIVNGEGQVFEQACSEYFANLKKLWTQLSPGLLQNGDVVSTWAEGDNPFTTKLGWNAGMAKYKRYVEKAADFIDELRQSTGLKLYYTESICGGEARLRDAFDVNTGSRVDFISWDEYAGVMNESTNGPESTARMKREAEEIARCVVKYSEMYGTKVALGEWSTHWGNPKSKDVQKQYLEILATALKDLDAQNFAGMEYFHFALPAHTIDFSTATGYWSSPILDKSGPFPAYGVLKSLYTNKAR